MSHKQIQRKLILFLDSELTDHEMTRIRQHLKQCSSCSTLCGAISKVYQTGNAVKRPEPSSYLWALLAKRIEESETDEHLFTDYFEKLVQLARPAVIVLTLVVAILLGVYLGNIPTPAATNNVTTQSLSQDLERFYNSIYLDSFRDLPPESVGGVYVTLASDESGGAQ